MSIVQVDAPDGILFVELSDDAAPSRRPAPEQQPARREGSEPVSALPSPLETYKALQELMSGLSGLVKRQIDELSPDECSVEAKIGFAGKVNPIPFLVGAKSDATLSLKLTWKKKPSA
jgi:hypothetical protein